MQKQQKSSGKKQNHKRPQSMSYEFQRMSAKTMLKQKIERKNPIKQQAIRPSDFFQQKLKYIQPQKSQCSLDLDLYRPVPCLNDNFGEHFRSNYIDEWYESSIRYYEMQPYLQAAIKIHQDNCQTIIEQSEQKIRLLPLDVKAMKCMVGLERFINKMTNVGYRKYMNFLQYKLSQIVCQWQQLRRILQQLSVVEIRTHEHCLNRHYIKQIIKIIFTNLHCLNFFIKVNQQCLEYIHQVKDDIITPMIKTQNQSGSKKRKKALLEGVRSNIIRNKRSFGSIYTDHKDKILAANKLSYGMIQEQQPQKQFIHGIIDVSRQKEITKAAFQIQQACRNLYGQMVYMDENKTNRLDSIVTLNIAANSKETSKKDFFLTGMFIGLTLLTVIAMIGLLFTDLIDIHEDNAKADSFIYIFPAFRGIGLFILYLWGNAWNVYGFSKFNVNYRFILEYGSHYSTFYQLVKRAGFFTLVYIGAFLFYMIGEQINVQMKSNQIPVVYSAFFVWIIFFSYIFFPNRDVFNPRGRKYFYKLFKEVIKSPILPMSFLIAYATDQACSFVVPIKDMAYSICYYTSDLTPKSVKNCLNTANLQGVIVIYVVAIIPLFFRMVQCYNQAIQQTGKFRGHIQFWNFFKYVASLTTATISFISTFYDFLFYVFVVSSIVSTLYSYYWDLKYDWGLLEKNSKNKLLRNNLSYKNPKIYYVAIGINLIMRSSWTLTISASITNIIPKSTFLPFFIGLIEILRRCMWNFFRVEKQHIANCAQFRISKDAQPIFKSIENNKDRRSDQKGDQTLLNSLIEGDAFFYMYSPQALSQKISISEQITQTQVKNKWKQFQAALEDEKQILKQSEKNSKLQNSLTL